MDWKSGSCPFSQGLLEDRWLKTHGHHPPMICLRLIFFMGSDDRIGWSVPPMVQVQQLRFLKEESEAGCTVVYCTHILDGLQGDEPRIWIWQISKCLKLSGQKNLANLGIRWDSLNNIATECPEFSDWWIGDSEIRVVNISNPPQTRRTTTIFVHFSALTIRFFGTQFWPIAMCAMTQK